MADEARTEVYRLHVWICRISPMIWLRLLVRCDSTIAALHYALQCVRLERRAFEWSSYPWPGLWCLPRRRHHFLCRSRQSPRHGCETDSSAHRSSQRRSAACSGGRRSCCHCAPGLQFDLRSAQGKLIASLMAALAEFEHDLLRERVRSGIAAARKRGVVFGRRPGQRVKADRFAAKVLKLVDEGQSYREISYRLRQPPE